MKNKVHFILCNAKARHRAGLSGATVVRVPTVLAVPKP